MARTYLVFGDIEGKLDVLRVECNKCPRNGRYSGEQAAFHHIEPMTSTASARDQLS